MPDNPIVWIIGVVVLLVIIGLVLGFARRGKSKGPALVAEQPSPTVAPPSVEPALPPLKWPAEAGDNAGPLAGAGLAAGAAAAYEAVTAPDAMPVAPPEPTAGERMPGSGESDLDPQEATAETDVERRDDADLGDLANSEQGAADASFAEVDLVGEVSATQVELSEPIEPRPAADADGEGAADLNAEVPAPEVAEVAATELETRESETDESEAPAEPASAEPVVEPESAESADSTGQPELIIHEDRIAAWRARVAAAEAPVAEAAATSSAVEDTSVWSPSEGPAQPSAADQAAAAALERIRSSEGGSRGETPTPSESDISSSDDADGELAEDTSGEDHAFGELAPDGADEHNPIERGSTVDTIVGGRRDDLGESPWAGEAPADLEPSAQPDMAGGVVAGVIGVTGAALAAVVGTSPEAGPDAVGSVDSPASEDLVVDPDLASVEARGEQFSWTWADAAASGPVPVVAAPDLAESADEVSMDFSDVDDYDLSAIPDSGEPVAVGVDSDESVDADTLGWSAPEELGEWIAMADVELPDVVSGDEVGQPVDDAGAGDVTVESVEVVDELESLTGVDVAEVEAVDVEAIEAGAMAEALEVEPELVVGWSLPSAGEVVEPLEVADLEPGDEASVPGVEDVEVESLTGVDVAEVEAVDVAAAVEVEAAEAEAAEVEPESVVGWSLPAVGEVVEPLEVADLEPGDEASVPGVEDVEVVGEFESLTGVDVAEVEAVDVAAAVEVEAAEAEAAEAEAAEVEPESVVGWSLPSAGEVVEPLEVADLEPGDEASVPDVKDVEVVGEFESLTGVDVAEVEAVDVAAAVEVEAAADEVEAAEVEVDPESAVGWSLPSAGEVVEPLEVADLEPGDEASVPDVEDLENVEVAGELGSLTGADVAEVEAAEADVAAVEVEAAEVDVDPESAVGWSLPSAGEVVEPLEVADLEPGEVSVPDVGDVEVVGELESLTGVDVAEVEAVDVAAAAEVEAAEVDPESVVGWSLPSAGEVVEPLDVADLEPGDEASAPDAEDVQDVEAAGELHSLTGLHVDGVEVEAADDAAAVEVEAAEVEVDPAEGVLPQGDAVSEMELSAVAEFDAADTVEEAVEHLLVAADVESADASASEPDELSLHAASAADAGGALEAESGDEIGLTGGVDSPTEGVEVPPPTIGGLAVAGVAAVAAKAGWTAEPSTSDQPKVEPEKPKATEQPRPRANTLGSVWGVTRSATPARRPHTAPAAAFSWDALIARQEEIAAQEAAGTDDEAPADHTELPASDGASIIGTAFPESAAHEEVPAELSTAAAEAPADESDLGVESSASAEVSRPAEEEALIGQTSEAAPEVHVPGDDLETDLVALHGGSAGADAAASSQESTSLGEAVVDLTAADTWDEPSDPPVPVAEPDHAIVVDPDGLAPVAQTDAPAPESFASAGDQDSGEVVAEASATDSRASEIESVPATATSGPRISEASEVMDGGYGWGSAAPIPDGAQPLGHPVKANWHWMKYQEPGDPWYAQISADVWFTDAETARRNGFSHD